MIDGEWMKKHKWWLHLLALVIGLFLGWLIFFQVPFLYRVIPHGGL